jgi:hypothetical protein
MMAVVVGDANRYHNAFSTAFAWAVLCTLLAHARGRPSDQVESFLFFCTLPSVAFTGYVLCSAVGFVDVGL